VRSLSTAFLLTRRAVFEDIARTQDLPVCNKAWPTPVVPYFQPFVVDEGEGGPQYLGDSQALCERARRAGHRVMLDTSIRLWRVGPHSFGWEDVLTPIRRTPSAKLPGKAG
jgi:hypothetical protein